MELILPLQSVLKPVVTEEKWDMLCGDTVAQADERLHCMVEPWYWLVNYVYTIRKDENVEGGVVERYPADEYLRYVFHKLFTESKFCCDKSRQVRMNWTVSAWGLWHIQYRRNEEIICQTKKEADADVEIIQRAYGMWKRQPSWIANHAKYHFCHLEFPDMESKMVGIPKGADQIRSHNPTRYIGDEGGFWEGDFEECRTAALACCEDVKLISTANAGEWSDFINDQLVA